MTVEELKAEEAAWVDQATDPGVRAARQRRVRCSDVERDRVDQRWEMEAYDAVRAGVPVYVTAPVPHLPFLGGAIDAVAAYTLDRLDERRTLPSGPWSA